jgi:basic membrane lipoprotein Med (substrate-binding protein (PBP1-ABC) superfamily)
MKKIMSAVCVFAAAFFTGCSGTKKSPQSIAVFVPGIVADSPVYEMLTEGVKSAVETFNSGRTGSDKAQLSILEAGTNQAEWGQKLTALAAEGKYSVIISSNPSLPDLVEPLTSQFPAQKFILLDAYMSGNSSIATVRYNQHEQSYLTGYMAGLMSKTHKIGLLAAQEYPVMNDVILPGYTEGAQAAFSGTSVDFRILGNWYDATKGAELADAMYSSGDDVVLPICGGAAQGVISSAKEHGFFITWFDDVSFDKAPDNIVSCTVLDQVKAAKEITSDYLDGKVSWGTAKTVGAAEGYIRFIQDSAERKNPAVGDDIRAKMASVVNSIADGTLRLPQN